jgi:hypothetical protein
MADGGQGWALWLIVDGRESPVAGGGQGVSAPWLMVAIGECWMAADSHG